MTAATVEPVAQRWATLKANADAYADLQARSRELWKPIARDMAALRAEYPANQAFSKALDEHGIELSYNDRAAFIWLGENLTTDQQWTEKLALSPRTSVRTFVDAIRLKASSQPVKTAQPAPPPSSQTPVKPTEPATVEFDVPDPLRKLAYGAESKFTDEELKALRRTLTADIRNAVKARLDDRFEQEVNQRVRAITDEKLKEEWGRCRMAQDSARAKEAHYIKLGQGEPMRMTQEEFRILRSVFSTDREASPEMRTRAAQIWNAKTAHIKWPKGGKA